MKIKKLEIKQFRGLNNVTLDFNEKLNVLCGKNGIGKTTIIDSILWMLSDETIVYGKENGDNKNQHNLEDKVNVLLTLDDGLVLERNYYDVYDTNDEGDYVFKKNENKFLINGAKFSKTEYFNFIKNKIGLNRMFTKAKNYNVIRSIIDYNYFPTTETKVARAFIEELLNLESDLSIASKEEFANIKNDLIALNYDASKVKNKYKNLYDECGVKINEKEVLIKEYESKYTPEIDEKYNKALEIRNELLNSSLNHSEQYLELTKRLKEIDNEIVIEEKNNIESKSNLEKEIIKINGEGQKNKALMSNLKDVIESKGNKKNRINLDIAKLREQLKINEENFVYQLCPNCNSPINLKEKEFISKNYQEKIESNLNEIKEIDNEIENKKNELKGIEEKQKELGASYFKKKEQLQDVVDLMENNEKVLKLRKEQADIQIVIKDLESEFSQKRSNDLQNITKVLDELSSIKILPSYIEKLKEELSVLKKQKALAELNQDLAVQFKDYKVKLIKDNTKKVFPKLEFELIEEYKTGSTKDVCYVKLRDVEYKGINDGHRKFVGIILIEDIKRALGIEDMPIIFDKYADLDSTMVEELLKETNSQLICTCVTDENEIIINEK